MVRTFINRNTAIPGDVSAGGSSAKSIDRFVVVDVETTGLYNNDRIVELAAVSVDLNGRIIDEWDTLIDPQRDVGPTWLHGVTASMISNAPTFEDVGGAFAARLNGAVLVGHNLPFDTRFIEHEYQRAGAHAEAGRGVDTLQLEWGKLNEVCARLGVELSNHHRALADARATAQVFTKCFGRVDMDGLVPGSVFHELPARPRTLRREATAPPPADALKPPFLGYLAASLSHSSADGRTMSYLELLDWALADLVIDAGERQQLRFLAHALGFSDHELRDVHLGYLAELIQAAQRDGVVTDDERDQLRRASEALQVDWDRIEGVVDLNRAVPESVSLEPGMHVCFTGNAGTPRAELEHIARGMGLHPESTVTRRRCSLVVACDINTRSGKAANARKWGIPIMALDEFLTAARGLEGASI